jgi:hypothetical protein
MSGIRAMVMCSICFFIGVACLPSHGSAESRYSSQSRDDGADKQSWQDKPCPSMPVVYVNKEYGFRFHLPKSWKGYSILAERWEGEVMDESGNEGQSESGPTIVIRHPQWSETDPHQDIPIMIFTLAQWGLIDNETLTVSAAPIGPSDLARNNRYVFALPPRYNYAFETGWEEVQKIADCDALRPF